MTTADALYVYGVVRSDTPAEVFADVEGTDDGPVRLVGADGVAAITGSVPLAEFDTDALEQNLKKSAWLEQKVQAHNRVLAAAVGRTTVLPFRFGAIYRSEDHVRRMLGERPELEVQLARLEGVLEFGVKAVLDPRMLRTRLEETRGVEADEGSGRAYMLRKRLAQDLDEEVRAFAVSCADASHERLVAAAVDARVNPAQSPEMILNGAYLVAADGVLRSALDELDERFGPEGVKYELTGPWPPYNFAGEGPDE